MKFVAALFALKMLTLAGSTATTLWAISFIAFTDALGPHRWSLFGWGFAAIAVGEGAAYLLARHLQKL